MSINTPFKIESRKIALNFVQSALMFDDKALLEDPPVSTNIIDPDTEGSAFKGPEFSGAEEIPEENDQQIPISTGGDAEVLYSKKINSVFADKGIVCGILKPVPPKNGARGDVEETTAAICEAAKRADIVIFDWIIGDDSEGKYVIAAIKSILNGDLEASRISKTGRLRLLSIYTSRDLNEVVSKLLEDTQLKLRILDEEDKFTLVTNTKTSPSIYSQSNVRICLYKKHRGGVDEASSPFANRVVKDADLPDKLISDFAEMTRGLLANMVIASLSLLRDNTHQILTKFNFEVDAPYLTHRILSNPADETKDHIINLFSSELEDLFLGNKIPEVIDLNAISVWLDDFFQSSGIAFGELSKEDTLDLFKFLISNGLDKTLEVRNEPKAWIDFLSEFSNSKRDDESKLTTLFLPPAEKSQAHSRDVKFSVLASMRSQYNNDNPIPQLKLGSIVSYKNGQSVDFLVCIQPLCDSVRIEEESRQYPFLRLSSVSKEEKFDLIVMDGRRPRYFRINYAPFKMTAHDFKPDADAQVVLASKDKGRWFFTSVSQQKFDWIAELKFAHAQRIVNEFASKISRVGLNESEWQRRMASHSNPKIENKDAKPSS